MEYVTSAPKGFALMNQVDPGWIRVVNTETLNMASYARCILGQRYGDYCTGMEEIFGKYTLSLAEEYGFTDRGSSTTKFARLTEEWLDLIGKALAEEEAKAA